MIEVRKLEESCDDSCKLKCDKDADRMIRELANPLTNITWNCKNNYDVYTTDYDPHNSHFDRISMDVMDVQRILVTIRRLEKQKAKKSTSFFNMWDDEATLRALKREMGLPED